MNDSEEKLVIKDAESSSFGSFDAEIKSVTIKGEKSHSSMISSGEHVSISIIIDAKANLPDMTVGIMIRDKFGQDIFGTNT